MSVLVLHLEELISRIADSFPQTQHFLRDMFFVSLIRTLNTDRYVGEIRNPLLRVEAILHLDPESREKVEYKLLEDSLRYHPLGVLIYAGRNFDDLEKKTFTKIVRFSSKNLNLLALAISYTGSENLYRDVFVGIVEDETKPRRVLSIAILLDFITFRYCMNSVLPYTEDLIKKYLVLDEIPNILKRMLISTGLVLYARRGRDITYEKEMLIRGIRLSSDDPIFLQAASVLAKNIYMLGEDGVFREIMLRLNELRRSMTRRHGLFDFIVPPPPGRLTRLLREAAYIINSILASFEMLCRSDTFDDNDFALSYLETMFKELSDPTTLYVLTRFRLRTDRGGQREVLEDYLSAVRRILPKEEQAIIYRQLGAMFAMKQMADSARRLILEVLPRDFDALKNFVFGLYEETLKQYPIANV